MSKVREIVESLFREETDCEDELRDALKCWDFMESDLGLKLEHPVSVNCFYRAENGTLSEPGFSFRFDQYPEAVIVDIEPKQQTFEITRYQEEATKTFLVYGPIDEESRSVIRSLLVDRSIGEEQ